MSVRFFRPGVALRGVQKRERPAHDEWSGLLVEREKGFEFLRGAFCNSASLLVFPRKCSDPLSFSLEASSPRFPSGPLKSSSVVEK